MKTPPAVIVFYRSLIILPLLALVMALTPGQEQSYSLIFIGDSITESKMVSNPSEFGPAAQAVSQLKAKKAQENIRFSNQGHSGYTTLDFLPEKSKGFAGVISAADRFAGNSSTRLIFSIMLGTNDSAVHGPHGAPVSPEQYRQNLQAIADSLLKRYRAAKLVFHQPIWYSDSTQNTSVYLTEGRTRLQHYTPQIRALVKYYAKTQPGRVFMGDENAYGYFRKHYRDALIAERGPKGTFYLHPNKAGAAALGKFWTKALLKSSF